MLQIETKAGANPAVHLGRGLSDERAWKICHFGLRAALKVGDYPRSIEPGKPDRDLCNSARGSLSKVDAVGVLHRAKVFPREMSPA